MFGVEACEIGQSVLTDFFAVSIGLSEQYGGLSASIGDGFDVHGHVIADSPVIVKPLNPHICHLHDYNLHIMRRAQRTNARPDGGLRSKIGSRRVAELRFSQ